MPSLYLHIFTYALFPNRKAEKTFGADLVEYAQVQSVQLSY